MTNKTITHSNLTDYVNDIKREKRREGVFDFDLALTPAEFSIALDVANMLLYPYGHLPDETKTIRFMGVNLIKANPLFT